MALSSAAPTEIAGIPLAFSVRVWAVPTRGATDNNDAIAIPIIDFIQSPI